MRRSLFACALLVCIMTACGDDDSTGPDTAVTTVEMRDDTFNPATVTIGRGTTVRWRNVGNSVHNTTSVQAGLWSSGNLNRNSTFSRLFDAAGTFNYTCTLHPGMNGTVVVQ